MGIPTPVKNLYVSNTTLNQAPSIQATGREGSSFTSFLAIKFKGGFRLLRQVHELGHRGLHAVCHFMLTNPGKHLGVAVLLMMFTVENGKGVELSSPILSGNTLGIAQVKNGVALAAQKDSLVIRRHETRSPKTTKQALLGMCRLRVHNNVVRQVLIHAPKTVTQPSSKARATGNLTTRLYVSNGRIVVDGLRIGTANDAKVLNDSRGMGKQGTDPDAIGIVLMLGELVLAWSQWQGLLARSHSGDPLTIANVIGQILSVVLRELGLVIPQVVVTGATTHEEINHTLGLGLVVQTVLGLPKL